jgi:hypothetical protein
VKSFQSLQPHVEPENNVHTDIDNESSPVSHTTKPIYRLGRSEILACNNCKNKGDKWYMQQHLCSGC